jgi:hypothetical protein
VGIVLRSGRRRSLEISVEYLAESGPVTPGTQTKPEEKRAQQQDQDSRDLATAQDSGTEGGANRRRDERHDGPAS